MSHSELLAALDERLDALLSGGADFLDLTDPSPDALELQHLLNAARLTIRVLEEPVPPATRARHMAMLKDAARRRRAGRATRDRT